MNARVALVRVATLSVEFAHDVCHLVNRNSAHRWEGRPFPPCSSLVNSGHRALVTPHRTPRETLLSARDGPGFVLDHVGRLSQRRSPGRACWGSSRVRSHGGHRRLRTALDGLSWNGDLPAGISLLPGLLRTAWTQPDGAGGSSSPPPRANVATHGLSDRPGVAAYLEFSCVPFFRGPGSPWRSRPCPLPW
jgi:hypothetical protein